MIRYINPTPLALILLIASFFWMNRLQSQDIPKLENKVTFIPYIGGPVSDHNIKIGVLSQRGDADVAGLPFGVGLKTECRLTEKIGIQIDLNFVHTGVKYYEQDVRIPMDETEYIHHRMTTRFRSLLGINFYLTNTAEKTRYISLNAGLKWQNRSYTVDGIPAELFYTYPLFTGSYNTNRPIQSFRLAYGFRKDLSSKFFINGEVGIGSNPVQFGFGIKL